MYFYCYLKKICFLIQHCYLGCLKMNLNIQTYISILDTWHDNVSINNIPNQIYLTIIATLFNRLNLKLKNPQMVDY